MAKREFGHPNEMHKYVGQEIGVSDWVQVTQERIDQFAEATGDHQWIHVDVERAKKDMPGGKTIAHGFLTLSLIPMLNHQISHINNVRNGINYGCNKVRFTAPWPRVPRFAPAPNFWPRTRWTAAACVSPTRSPSRSRDRSIRPASPRPCPS